MEPSLIGTIPQWLTLGGVGGILGIVLRYRLGWRKLGNEAQKQHDADEADIRDHYANEVVRLTRRIEEVEDRYRRLLKEVDDDREQLRKRVSYLEDEIKGLVRLITFNSADTVLQLGDDVPEDIREAAERVRTIIKTQKRQ